MRRSCATGLREQLGLGSDSYVLLINSEGNTSADDFRFVVWEGGVPIPEEYRMYSPVDGFYR